MTDEKKGRDPRLVSSLFLAALVAGSLVLGVAVTGIGSTVVHYTNRTEFCVDCHVYDEFYAHYKTSTHYSNAAGVRAGCDDCHVPDSTWWAMLTTKARSGVAAYWAYYVEGLDTPEEFAKARPRLQEAAHAWFEARDSDTCRSCHVIDESMLGAQSAAARGSHKALLSEDGPTCVSCHADVPHGTVEGTSETTEAVAASADKPEAEETAEDGSGAETGTEEGGETERAAEGGIGADGRVADASAGNDPAQGQTVARKGCVMCHKLPDGTGTTVAPPLADVMKDKPLSGEKLGEILAQPQHAPAKARLKPADYPDLGAYLNGLR